MVFLGVRPRGSTPGWHVLGRETFACTIDWVDDWPVTGAPIEPGEQALTEDLGPNSVPHSWVGSSHASVLDRGKTHWEIDATNGERFAGRRQSHFFTESKAVLHGQGGLAGFEIRMDPRHRFGLYPVGDRVFARATIGGFTLDLGSAPYVDSSELVLTTSEPTDAGSGLMQGPDELRAGVHGDTGYIELARFDGRYLSTEVAGGFTGRMVGVHVAGGRVEVESFRYSGTDRAPSGRDVA